MGQMNAISLSDDGLSTAIAENNSTPIGRHGLAFLHPTAYEDDRGRFTVTWKGRIAWWQDAEVVSYRPGTIRGLHYQGAMWQQAKLIRVLSGRIHDVCVHLATREVHEIQMSSGSATMLYVPKGFAHGYMTLEPETIVAYKISDVYSPDNEAGLRWNDPALAIQWPAIEPILNDRDASWPLLARAPTNPLRLMGTST